MSAIKRISCKRCQHRKIKCSRTYPCINCTSARANCEYREVDAKRSPVTREYVAALETRVASLESLLTSLKSSSSKERDQILNSMTFEDHLPEPFDKNDTATELKTATLIDATTKPSFQENEQGLITYHGPTSIYREELPQSLTPKVPVALSYSQGELVDESISRTALALFFRWQYSQFMFIPREAFLQDYLKSSHIGHFCSPELVNAMCAIGALLSSDTRDRDASSTFFEAAHTSLMAQGLAQPHITSVQAFLCLAFYEIAIGNLSKGWLYSGMAFRLGQDLGFQRDPKGWISCGEATDYENEVRRRIYWGCYMSDKLISLFLGRPTLMQEDDADVDTSEPLPQHKIWESWLSKHGLQNLADPMPMPRLTLVFNKQIELGKIVEDILSRMFAPKRNAKQTKSMELSLHELNSRFWCWYQSLPSDMRLKKSYSNTDIMHPNIANLHMLYHSARISLNRPFLISKSSSTTTTSSVTSKMTKNAQDICEDSTDSIILILRLYKAQYELRNAPMLFVHGTIVASNVALVLTRNQTSSSAISTDSRLPFLDLALEDLSNVWNLAFEGKKKLRRVIQLRENQRELPYSIDTDSSTNKNAGSYKNHGETSKTQSDPVNLLHSQTTDEMMSMPSNDISIPSLNSSPEQYIWDPLALMDVEANYWYTTFESYGGNDPEDLGSFGAHMEP